MDKLNSEKLKELKKVLRNRTITHWIRDMGVKCHIFTIKINTKMKLENIWQNIVDEIATYFLTVFEDEYETWNLYIVFLADFKIPRDVKYKIENDKYSSRKIVMDNLLPPIDEEKIKDKISKRIFQLDLDRKETAEKPKKDLSKILDPKLFKLIYGKELEGLTIAGKKEREKIFNKFNKLSEEYSHEI
jgi:hypothetical protein